MKRCKKHGDVHGDVFIITSTEEDIGGRYCLKCITKFLNKKIGDLTEPGDDKEVVTDEK